MNYGNLIGPSISKLRQQRKWSQETLAVKMQLQGCDISRDVIANIELRRTPATDTYILYFILVFKVGFLELMPDEIQVRMEKRPPTA